MPGHHAVARDLLALHAEVGRAVLDEHVVFLERARIEQHVDALARRQLALGMLRLDAALAPALPCGGPAPFELFQHLLHWGPRPLRPVVRRDRALCHLTAKTASRLL